MNLPVRRLGVFGGAFDPPHQAHAALAHAAVAQLGLDRLCILPTGQAWHKTRPLTPAAHRLAMARMAFADLPAACVDDREIRRAGPTYTVETLRELHAEHPGAELFLIMGEDQARAFTTWRDWPAIAALATLCVAQRHALATLCVAQRHALAQPQPDAPRAAGPQAGGDARFGLPAQARVLPLALLPMAHSATGIRAAFQAGGDATSLLSGEVAGYIARNHLYRSL